MKLSFVLCLLALSLPAHAAPKSPSQTPHHLSGHEQLAQLSYQTGTLDDYQYHRISRATLIRRLLKGKIVLIGHAPSLTGRLMNIQNYIWYGKSFYPFFTEPYIAQHKMRGIKTRPGMTLWETSCAVAFGLFKHNEWIIINGGVPDAISLHANEFRPYLRSTHH